jgi:alpha-tubulin suppressor-like RCC1 family protein
MAYNIIQYDSSNLKILNNIETLNGEFISKGQNVITNVSNYVLSTSNILTTHINDLNSKIFDSSNLVKIERLPVAKYDANGSKLGIIKVDGITITVDESGIIRGNSNIDLTAYATKTELSSVASGLTVLENADLATTANINLSGSVDYTTTTIDGSWPTSGSSILVKNQTNKAQNGIYILTLTSGPTYSTWQRRSDFNTSQNIKKGSYIFVKRGVENKNTGFINSLDITTLNTSPIEFNLFTKTEITAGTGIALSGSTVSIKASANGGIVFNSDSAEINLSASSIQGVLPIVKGGIGASSLANLINLDTDTNSILPIAKGGTGASSFTNLINLDTDTNSILPLAKGGTGASSFANLINLSTDTNGVLPVAKGGTGTSTLVPTLLVVGNGTNIPLQSANLSWNNDTNTLAATNITGSGANITNINVGNASAGILPIVRGGTGSSTLTADIITQGINNRFIINNKISLLNQQDLRVATNIIPDENDKYSLGSSNLRWKDIFVSANTITIGEAKLSSSPTGALEMSSVSFTEKINLITSNELHTLVGINRNVQQQINELNLDGIADGTINRYIKNDQYDGSITVYSNLNVGTYYSTENPNGNLRVFGDLILEGSNITTFNPLITQIHRHLSNYNIGFIDIHNIDVSSNKPSIKIKHNTNYSNILECYSKNDMELNNAVFIISSNGNIGIANNIPTEKLDVIGNIKYTGKINNITAAELNYLSGINYNIKQRIDNNDAQQSNFTLNVSNILQTEYKLLDRNVSNYILNVSNILQSSSKETNVSNYILSVSNMITIDYKRLDNNVSNYILNVSNLLSTDYKMLDKNVSNYVLVSNNNTSKYASNLNVGMSNYLTASITTTSNVISSRISSLTADNIAQGTQNKYITNNTYSGQLNINSATDNQSLLNITASQNNAPDADIINIKKGTTDLFKMISNGFIGVRKGANLPTVPLDVEGDIKFSGKINDITASELNNLKDINYNIKQRIDTNDSRQSNYISVVNTNISQNLNTNDSRQSNYISAVNTNISQRITNINTDTITQGTQKKFIIDDIYNGNLIINSNLTVHGSTTTLNTDVYTTERLDITNINQMSTALTVRQMGESKKIISALKDSEPDVEIFSVNTDGSIDVKGNISFGGDLFKGTEKFKASNWSSNVSGIASYSNVAIGKDVAVSSAYKLDVAGNVNISGDLYKGGSIFKASNWSSNVNGITSYSNVAIGKDVAVSSAYKLDVAGNINLSGDLYKAVNNCNYLIQTVKSDLYLRDSSTSTTSNLTAEPFVETEEKMYPPFRYFTSNNLIVEVQQQSINYSGPAILASGGGSHTAFLTNIGKVWTSGLNTNGQLGINNTTQQNLPIEITNASFYANTITSIACGNNHTLFLTSTGKVWSCGNPANGRLGLGTDITTNRTVPLEITNAAFYANTITAIATKDAHAVFLTSAGKVWSCGLNTNGQLGINNTTQQNVPIEITNASFYANTITSIACGQSHTLFLTSAGKVWSCGNPANGRLGLGTDITTNRTVPLEITNAGFYANTITAIACGDSHSIFLTSAGKVWSCGVNTNGQLGINNTTQQNVPTEITNASFILNTIVAISGGQTHTLFLTSTGKVWACGNPANGRLGLGTDITTNRLVPTIISDVSFNLNTIISISAGYSHSIFLSNTSKAWSCGINTNGQLAINNTTQQNLPTSIVYFGIVSFYGSGVYTVSYSSSTNNFEPFRCFNENSIVTVNNQGTWRTGNYLASGLFDSATYSTSNLVSGYNGDWVVIKLPVSIKLKRFQIKQISTDLNKAPKNFQLYGSTDGTSWVLLVDKQNTTYNGLIYSHTDMSQYPLNTNKYYNHYGLVVNALLGNETILSFDEFLIYGVESVAITPITTATTKALTFTPNAIVSLNSYNITFQTPTVSHINNNSNLILQGEYGINLSSTNSLIVPKMNQYLPINATSNLTPNITFIYHLRNPIKTIEGAQMTYNSSNTNVYHLGSMGIGNTNPEYSLDVSGDIRLTGDLYKGAQKIKFSNWTSNVNGIASYSNIAIGKDVAVSSAYKLDVSGAINSTSLNTGALTSTSLNTGIITSTSYIRPSAGSGNNGIIFPTDPGGGSGDAAWIKYYPRSGEACSLEIATPNDADDHIILQPNAGCVGINKVPEQAYKLDVEGSIKFNGNLNKNVNNNNHTIETVRSELYVKGNDSVLSQEPIIIKNILQPPATARNFTDNNVVISGIIPMRVTGSYYHTTFLTSNFKVYSCGYNEHGEMGIGNFGDYISTPTQITANGFDSSNIINIASKENHTLFVTSNLKVYSCGNNGFGQLGRDTGGNSSTEPIQIILNGFISSNIISASCGINHSLFLTSNYKVYSCGHNGQGQLGQGTIGTDVLTPTELRTDGFNQSNIISIAGGAAHSLFLTSNFKVFSCGQNNNGQLGHGTIDTNVLKPTKIILNGFNEYDYNVIKVVSGHYHNLFLTSNYKVYSCGHNSHGALGRDTGGQNSIIPTQITYNGFDNLNIVDISCGNYHSLFLTDNGRVYGCGYNNVGQTGRNTGGGNFYEPTLITGNDFNNVKINSVFGAGEFSIFLTSNINDNNTTFAYGCGFNYHYQLGIGNTDIYQYPVPLRFFAKTYKYLDYELSFTSSSAGLIPYNCFNDSSTASDGKWAINYNANGTFNTSYNNYYNNIGGYNGDWIILKVPSAIKPALLVIKQSETNINGAPKNFRLYASNDKVNWDLFIDKSNATYTSYRYHQVINTETTYNYFALIVSALIGNETALCINEIYIYGKEASVSGTDYAISTNTSTLTTSLSFAYDIAKANNYTITFPVSTIANVNNNYNLVFINSYNIEVGNNSYICPASGQNTPNIPKPNVLYGNMMSINYHLRNPVRDTNGAQWTYNAANTSVYHLGNVGIGNTNPIYSLDVVGNMYVSGNIRTSDTITSFGDYSDERLKDREENIENPLDIVGKLQGFYYRPNKTANDLGIKGNKMKRELGVSAQDVQKILPELIDIAPADISYDAENNVISKTGSNYLTVNYEKMIPLLIESIKELNKNINELKKENVELRDLIKSQ